MLHNRASVSRPNHLSLLLQVASDATHGYRAPLEPILASNYVSGMLLGHSLEHSGMSLQTAARRVPETIEMLRNARHVRKTTKYFFAMVAALFVAITVQVTVQVTAEADDWPQWRGPTRDGVWHETGVLTRFPAKQIKLRWKAEVSSGYSGPTVSAGRVYVTDRLVEDDDETKQRERVHCFDWRSGKRRWLHTYDCPYRDVSYRSGPRAAVSLALGRALV